MAIICYLALIGIYTRVSTDPIIFFASLVIAIVVVVAICLLIKRITERLFDKFTIFVIGIVYCLGLIILSVFGPTFIDRSISYHIAFYAAEENVVYIEDIEKEFSTDIFNKRIHDAITTGFLVRNQNGSLSPTLKAKILYHIMKPLGELTNSLDTYYDMKEEIRSDRSMESKIKGQ